MSIWQGNYEGLTSNMLILDSFLEANASKSSRLNILKPINWGFVCLLYLLFCHKLGIIMQLLDFTEPF